MGQENIGSGTTAGQQIYKVDPLAYGISTGYAPATINGLRFIPTSIPVQAGGDLKEYKDNTGRTCSIVISEAFQTISISGYLIKNGANVVIRKGDKVENLSNIDGMMKSVTWRVQDYTVNWQNEDVANVSVSVKCYEF
jgi:hypothetical protein